MKTQRGNILFLILLAVVLFAALSYAVTQSTRGGGSDASSEKAQAQASEILNYFAQMDAAVQRMMLTGGVKDYELNFYQQTSHKFIYGASDNTNCTEARCRVFDPAGGGVSGQFLERFTRENRTDPERILYTNVPGVGTSAPDIVFLLHQPATSICREVNRKAGLPDIIFSTNVLTNGSTLMYQFPLPVGPIPDNGISTGGTPAMGSMGTFCLCSTADIASCEADASQPRLLHVLVAR
mgnify:CR=1 FL=1